jgi:hypothetical protein
VRRTLRTIVGAILIMIAGLVLYLLTWPVPIEPVALTPSPNPGMTGPFVRNELLRGVEHLIPHSAGPEDVTRGPDGFLYAGLEDGRIVRFLVVEGSEPETFADTGGRPLGMQFDTREQLIVADGRRGLLSVNSGGEVSVLTDSVEGERMIFVDDLDIASDGTIWFSDASRRFGIDESGLDFLEGRATGRLVTYDPRTGETRVRLDGLHFANGVAVSPGDTYVLVNESFGGRITRLWLKGPRTGESEVFLHLPGVPDNLSYNGRGVFWVALPAPRARDVPYPFLRKVLARLPLEWLMGLEPYGWVIGVSPEGQVLHNLQDPTGEYGFITSVNEFDGQLYLGSVAMTSVGRVPVPR